MYLKSFIYSNVYFFLDETLSENQNKSAFVEDKVEGIYLFFNHSLK